jgi:uncharacterized protein
MSSTDAAGRYAAHREALLKLARDAIRHGLEAGEAPAVDTGALPPELQAPGAAFVTLTLGGQLRGCIGSLQAYRPLAADVSDNAYNAAFRDPRFPPLTPAEFERLHLHISILTPSEPMEFRSEEDLLAQLRPGVDGLVIAAAGRRGTFLPSVWEQLPDRHDFLRHLKLKAGLPQDYWSDDVQVWRYGTESIEE